MRCSMASRLSRLWRRCGTTGLVVDASVLAVTLGDDGSDGDRARARLRVEDLAAPELLDLEVASVLRRQVSVDVLDARRAGLALDAANVALAEAPQVDLLTGDNRLPRA